MWVSVPHTIVTSCRYSATADCSRTAAGCSHTNFTTDYSRILITGLQQATTEDTCLENNLSTS